MMRDRPTRAAKLSTDLALPWDGSIIYRNGRLNKFHMRFKGVLSMNYEPSMNEHPMNTELSTKESHMELSTKQELIRQLKDAKEKNEITYPRLIDMIEAKGNYVSLSTLRRVFADGSESIAQTFSYENTLMPIADALLNVEDVPTSEVNPYAKEIDGLKAVIHVQNEEIARLHELKEHLEERITFLLEQIERKDRRMDEKDEIIRRLMDKCL